MKRLVMRLALAVVFATAASALAIARSQSALSDNVQVSAIVVDGDGLPVRGLTAADFTVREDGQPVKVSSFGTVTAGDKTRGRSIVLLLGGSGVRPELTRYVQEIAQRFFDRAGDDDQVSVVRFAVNKDEVAGSRNDMLMRLAEYRAPYGPPLYDKSQWDVLKSIAKVSRDMEQDLQPRRRAIVWIGPAWLVDVVEPPLRERELIWKYWVEALTTTARANVSVYAIDPAGLTGRVRLNPDGLIAYTGGASLENTNDWDDAVNQIWQETGSYYSFEYAPSGGKAKTLHSIEVKGLKPGVEVRARRVRGAL